MEGDAVGEHGGGNGLREDGGQSAEQQSGLREPGSQPGEGRLERQRNRDVWYMSAWLHGGEKY